MSDSEEDEDENQGKGSGVIPGGNKDLLIFDLDIFRTRDCGCGALSSTNHKQHSHAFFSISKQALPPLPTSRQIK
jgi:hypothetical protein